MGNRHLHAGGGAADPCCAAHDPRLQGLAAAEHRRIAAFLPACDLLRLAAASRWASGAFRPHVTALTLSPAPDLLLGANASAAAQHLVDLLASLPNLARLRASWAHPYVHAAAGLALCHLRRPHAGIQLIEDVPFTDEPGPTYAEDPTLFRRLAYEAFPVPPYHQDDHAFYSPLAQAMRLGHLPGLVALDLRRMPFLPRTAPTVAAALATGKLPRLAALAVDVQAVTADGLVILAKAFEAASAVPRQALLRELVVENGRGADWLPVGRLLAARVVQGQLASLHLLLHAFDPYDGPPTKPLNPWCIQGAQALLAPQLTPRLRRLTLPLGPGVHGLDARLAAAFAASNPPLALEELVVDGLATVGSAWAVRGILARMAEADGGPAILRLRFGAADPLVAAALLLPSDRALVLPGTRELGVEVLRLQQGGGGGGKKESEEGTIMRLVLRTLAAGAAFPGVRAVELLVHGGEAVAVAVAAETARALRERAGLVTVLAAQAVVG